MNTYIYMVRHGESPKLEGDERTRGLTEKGKMDTHRVTDILKMEFKEEQLMNVERLWKAE